MFCVLFLDLLPLLFCAWVCLSAVVGGMLCKSDKPSIIIIIIWPWEVWGLFPNAYDLAYDDEPDDEHLNNMITSS